MCSNIVISKQLLNALLNRMLIVKCKLLMQVYNFTKLITIISQSDKLLLLD